MTADDSPRRTATGHETGSDVPTQRLGIDDSEARREDCVARWDGPCDCGDECLFARLARKYAPGQLVEYDPRHGAPVWCSRCGSHLTREPSGVLAKTVMIEPRGKPEPLYRIVWGRNTRTMPMAWARTLRTVTLLRRCGKPVARVERVN